MSPASTASGTSGLTDRSGAGIVVSFFARIERAFGPVNGGVPARAS